MALSGSFYKNVSSHWRLYASWTGSQSISGNYTNITLRLYWQGLDQYGTTYTSATKYGSTTINGSTDSFSGSAKLTGSESKLIQTHTVRVYHNSDGKKSINLSAYFDAELTLDGIWIGRVSISDSVTLNTIPRTSSITSGANFTAGSDYTISVSRASSSFTHRAYLDVKNSSGSWVNIKDISFSTSGNTSFSVAEKKEIFKALNGRSSMETRINVHTLSGGDSIGYDTKTGTVSVPSASTIKLTNPTYGESELAGQGASTVWIDQTIGITVSRHDSEFTHVVKFKDSNSGSVIHTSPTIEYTYNWTPSQAERDKIYGLIPDSVERDGQVDVYTYYEGILVRSATNIDINYRVRNSEPSFSDSLLYYADNNSVTSAITGDVAKIIQNVSTVRVLLPQASKAVAKNKASIVKYIAILGGQQRDANYTDADIYFYFDPINANTDQTLTIKAVDSRGFATEISRTVDMIPYQPPTLNASAKRKNGFDSETTLSANGQISDVLGKNSVKSVKYRYKKTSEATSVSTWAVWSSFTVTKTGLTYLTNNVVKSLDYTNTFNVEFLVEDQLGSAKKAMIVSTGKPILFIDSVLKTVGVGKFSTSHALDVAGTANFDSTIRVNGAHSILNGADLNWYNLKNVWEAGVGLLRVTTDAHITGNLNMGGTIKLPTSRYISDGAGLDANNSDIMGLNNLFFSDQMTSKSEGLQFPKSGTSSGDLDTGNYNTFRVYDGVAWIDDIPLNSLPLQGALWSGSYYLNDNQTVTPSKKLSECANGWFIVWSDYNADTATHANSDLVYSFIPKRLVQGSLSGGWSAFAVPNYSTSIVIKYARVYDDSLTGHANNDSGATNGSIGNPNDVVIRYVFEW
jgi:hypothetical protein